MSKADEKKLEQMLKDFEKANPDAGKSFRTLLNDTPALKANLLEAIGKGNLERIEAMPAGMTGTPGGYASKDTTVAGVPVKANTILISTTGLEAAGKDPKVANTMRMILTHESEHAVNKQAILKADKAFEDKLTAISKGPSPHDYTPPLKQKADSDRLREATDQIGGFNAVAAHVHKQNPTATKEQLYKLLHDSSPEMEPYFDVSGTPPKQTYAPKAGLTLDKNGHLAETPKNIEAMAQHFYDKRPYRQNYGVEALQRAIGIEAKEQIADAKADPKYTPPEVRVNLKELGLDRAVAFPPGSGITDTSPKPPPVAPPKPPIAPPEAPHTPGHSEPYGTRPAETAPALYLQSMTALEKLGPDAGIKSRDELGNVAAAMASKAQTDGLQKIDSVVPSTDGKGLIAVQGNLESVHAKSSYIDRVDAAQQSPEKNLEQLRQNPPTAEIAAPQLSQTGPAR
ncbi:MAG: XVIPCD domain-containing protein [Lysobacteraceae bacterium]